MQGGGIGQTAAVLPDQIAGDGVDGLDGVAGVGDEHDAIVNDRRGLHRAGFKTACPDHLELTDIVGVDLVERAETIVVDSATVGEPVAVIGVCEHFVGHRRQIAYRALGKRRYGEQPESRGPCKDHFQQFGRQLPHSLSLMVRVCC